MSEDLISYDGGFLACDMLGEASITDASELTSFPLEDGSIVSDHMIRQPRTLSLKLVQTETPISETTGFARAVQALSYQERPAGKQTNTVPIRPSEFRPAPLMALKAGIQSLLFGGPDKEIKVTGLKADANVASKPLQVHVLSAGAPADRVNDFYGQLLSLLAGAEPVLVTVKGYTYIDLVLVGVTRTDSSGQVGRASFSVELKQIATVETKTVNLPPVPKAKAPKQAGAKPAVQATATQEAAAQQSLEAFASTGPEELFSSERGP
jgi:hypothetical protein